MEYRSFCSEELWPALKDIVCLLVLLAGVACCRGCSSRSVSRSWAFSSPNGEGGDTAVEAAKQAIATGHVEAESVANGVGLTIGEKGGGRLDERCKREMAATTPHASRAVARRRPCAVRRRAARRCRSSPPLTMLDTAWREEGGEMGRAGERKKKRIGFGHLRMTCGAHLAILFDACVVLAKLFVRLRTFGADRWIAHMTAQKRFAIAKGQAGDLQKPEEKNNTVTHLEHSILLWSGLLWKQNVV
uniref:Uncharacterized protein n=1 Tax=Oryza sativa subsp. japonica TaxID=39947 RepID=Q6Z789_ORYSJ|nr:hypothetical protein [Oryza sativa Japonica Group]